MQPLHSTGFQRLKRKAQKSERHLLFQTCQHLSHAESALQKSRAVCRSADSKYRRGICFSKHVSICHMQSQLYENHEQFVKALFQTCQHLSHAESALGSLSKRFSRLVSICHMQSQLCGNHGQFVETPIPDIEEALIFSDVSAPITCTPSLVEITGNL
ncbi:hypothetical protein ACFX2K_025782 [Malus domestica]